MRRVMLQKDTLIFKNYLAIERNTCYFGDGIMNLKATGATQDLPPLNEHSKHTNS